MLKIKKFLTSLFKKREVIVVKTPEEIERENLRKKYRLEYLETYDRYFIQYEYEGEWWYLRQWDTNDYTFEKKRGNAIRIHNPNYLDTVIARHQEWIKGGRFYMPSTD